MAQKRILCWVAIGVCLTAAHAEPLAVESKVGIIPSAMANEIEANELSRYMLQRASSRQDAEEQAQALHSALEVDPEGTMYNLFLAWSDMFDMKYISVGQAEAAFESFSLNTQMLLHQNLAQARPNSSWLSFNHLSALLPAEHRPGVFSALPTTAPAPNSPPPRVIKWSKLPPSPIRAPPPSAPPPAYKTTNHGPFVVPPGNPPKSVNWTAAGKTGEVKDVGAYCLGGGWVSAAVSSMESALAIKFNITPVAFSTQVFLDCANSTLAPDMPSDDNCKGGDAADILYFAKLYTIPTEAVYPYIAATGIWGSGLCNDSMLRLPPKDLTWVQGSIPIYYQANNEVYLMSAVAIQPVVVYWTNGIAFPYYGGGVFDLSQQNDTIFGCTSNVTNHVMLVVGYDVTGAVGAKFWILQNSAGVMWGENGFARVEMTGDAQGPCGMYKYLVAANLNFRRPPPNVVKLPAAPPPGSMCSKEAPECKQLYTPSDPTLLADMCSALEEVRTTVCPCWCQVASS